MYLQLYVFCSFGSVWGNAIFSVHPSTSVLVNTMVDLTCVFNSGLSSVLFGFPDDGVTCVVSYYNYSCLGGCGIRETSCPNNRSFTVKDVVETSWNAKKIKCHVPFNTSIGSESDAFVVKVPVADVVLNSSAEDVNEKQLKNLTCQTSFCNPKATVIWYKGLQQITTGISTTYVPNKYLLEKTVSVLGYIGDANDNGQQVYCTANNLLNVTKESSRQTLDVKYAPPTDPILTAVGSLLVNEGQNVTLQCSLSTLGNPPITWSWMCGDDDLSAEATSSLTQSALILTANRKYNQKKCHCSATSSRVSLSYNRTSDKKNITVYYAPLYDPILSAIPPLVVNEGQNVTLRCSLSTLSNPPIAWSWVCGDDDLSAGATSNLTQSTVILTANRKYNQRTCHCSATSPRVSLSYNRRSDKKNITVFYAPLSDPIITAVSSLLTDEGQTFTIRCSLSTLSNPPIAWSWVCGDDDLSTGATSNLTQSTLTVTANRKYNQRTCHCSATSPRMSLSYNRRSDKKNITVYYNNIITSSFEQSNEINESESFQLICTVDGNPLSNITWIFAKNNSVLQKESNKNISLLHINHANCLDYGEYMVLAENGKGPVASLRTKITVKCKPRQYPADSVTSDKLGVGNNQSFHISTRILLYPSSDYIQWNITRKVNESIIISNKSIGYTIKIFRGENEENITLSKENVAPEDFGNYTVIVRNTIGQFKKKYQVSSARSPLPPINFTLVCDNPFSITLTWTADFNGGDKQTFHVFSSSGENNSYFKELTTVDDMGFGQIHSYSPAIDLYGQLWFRIAASNKFGNSTTDAIPCFTKTPDESPSNIAMLAGIAAGGGVCLAFVVLVVVVYFRKYKYENSAKNIERLNNFNENEEDGADVDGLKENSLYVSAGPRDDEKPEVAVYAAVAKKLPQSDNSANLYADVKKSGRDTNKGTMSSEVKPKKGLFKKDERAKHKKGKKQKNRLGEADVYENSEDIAMSRNVDNVYSNAGQKGLNKQEERGYKNKDGLLYVEVNFDGKQGQDNPVIHGEDEKTDYATVEFPMPSALHKASGSEEL